MYGMYITFQAGRPLGRPLRCGHKAAKTSHEPLTTNNKKSTSGCPTSPAESRVSLSDRILSLHQVTRFGISDSHGFARRRAPSKPVPCLSQGASPQVLSAFAGLTAVFGMGTGGSPQLSPLNYVIQASDKSDISDSHSFARRL